MNQPGAAQSPGSPSVTVVVATRNRSPLLARLLEAIEEQDYPHFDVCVVDDASHDGTWAVLAAWEGPGRTVVRYDSPRGSYWARNQGWRASAGDIVAFTDDDCVPAPWWISSLVATVSPAGTVGAQGVTLAEPGATTPFTHQIDQRDPGTPYRTCNIAYVRRVLQELGGFDDRFHSYGDTLFGLRARQRGLIAFAPDAVVLHPPRPKEWHTRPWWNDRLRDDLSFRMEARRLGMQPVELGEVQHFMASEQPGSAILWAMRPLCSNLRFHLQFFLGHPVDYARHVPGMVQDRWSMIGALVTSWLRRSPARGTQ